ncbi:hypothetical protein [Streptomyces sp. NPDC048720]|uniref:hypothetical protein n=1 Tax=Streptomyces sp. NPDC048720 TaxID=3365588 RepID=UPI00372130D8
MPNYFNFTKIAPDPPNDPLVNVATQLNANWDELDAKLGPYVNGTTVTPTEAGQEYFDASNRYAVWDGAVKRVPDDIDAAWSAWNNMPIFSLRAPRSGFAFKWRNNSLLRMVELTGGIQVDASASAWTQGTNFTLNADTSGAIPASMAPIGGLMVTQCATALTAGTILVASGRVTVDKPAGNTFVRVRGQYLGGPGGGNFMQLEGVWWWY